MLIPKHIENFVKEMERRNFSPLTIKNYKSCLCLFLEKHKHKEHPTHIVEQDIKDYLHSFVGVNYQRATHSAIKKYFEICFNQKHKFRYIPYAKKEQRLPVIIDAIDIQKLFDACTNPKHRAIMAVLYATGVRISELLSIKLTDINKQRGCITITGKGNKQRQVQMTDVLHTMLQQYWLQYRTQVYLFENDSTHTQYTARSVQEFLIKYKTIAGITAPVTPHKFRHSMATTLLENTTDLRIIQKALGHSSSKTTEIYTHVSTAIISKMYSPLSNLKL